MKAKMVMAVGLVGLTFCAVGESVEISVPANETKVLSEDFGGVLSDPAADPIVKTGEGTLVVDVSRTGATKLAAGTMRLSSSEIVLPSTAGDIVIAGGVLDLNGGSVTIAQSEDAGAEPSIAGGSVIRNGTLVYNAGNALYFPWTSGTVVLDHVNATCKKNLFAFTGDTGDRSLVISNESSFVCAVKTSSQIMSSNYASGFQTRIEVCDHSTFSHLGAVIYIGQQKNRTTGRGALIVTGDSTAQTGDLYLSDYVGSTHDSVIAVTNATLEAQNIVMVHNGSNLGLDRLLASNAVLTVNSINPRSRWKDLNFVDLTDCRMNARKDGNWLNNEAPNDTWAVYESYRMAGLVTLCTDYDSKAVLKATMTGSGTIVKDGSGTLTFLGPQKYSGQTIVSNGTLVLSWDAATAASTGSKQGLESRKVIEGGDVYVAPEGAIKIAYTNAFAATRSLSVDGTLLVTTNADLTVPVALVKNFTLGDGAKILVDADSVSSTDKVPFLRVKDTYLCGTVKVVDTKGRPWSVKTAAGTDFTELLLKKEQGLTLVVR